MGLRKSGTIVRPQSLLISCHCLLDHSALAVPPCSYGRALYTHSQRVGIMDIATSGIKEKGWRSIHASLDGSKTCRLKAACLKSGLASYVSIRAPTIIAAALCIAHHGSI